tara:strand:+ start:142 stop:369 length:228 start_codon:yes stop_codon:yes gene_type:complete
MKIGSLVRYKEFPHKKLHKSGMVGLVLSESYIPAEAGWVETSHVVDIMWNMDRGISIPAGAICWDYVDELEPVHA